jgi:hypothetical protein
MAGRPTKLTPELEDDLVLLLAAGASPARAARALGVGERSIRRGLGNGLRERVRLAQASGQVGTDALSEGRLVALIARAAAHDWKAAACCSKASTRIAGPSALRLRHRLAALADEAGDFLDLLLAEKPSMFRVRWVAVRGHTAAAVRHLLHRPLERDVGVVKIRSHVARRLRRAVGMTRAAPGLGEDLRARAVRFVASAVSSTTARREGQRDDDQQTDSHAIRE